MFVDTLSIFESSIDIGWTPLPQNRVVVSLDDSRKTAIGEILKAAKAAGQIGRGIHGNQYGSRYVDSDDIAKLSDAGITRDLSKVQRDSSLRLPNRLPISLIDCLEVGNASAEVLALPFVY